MHNQVLASALRGVTVLDFSRLLPGPYLSMVLGDLGAEVIKVEDTGAGDYLRTMPPLVGDTSARYLALNRNKQSVALDLKSQAGAQACKQLVRKADIVIESFRPGVMARLGLDDGSLRAINPRLIYCAITGYGQTGPYRDRAGHDLNYVALAGVLGNGQAGAQAGVPGAQIGDLVGGALWPLAGILAALYMRTQTGIGQYLDMSMTEGALALLAAELAVADPPPASAADAEANAWLTGGAATYQVYATSDGGALAVAPLEEKFATALVEIMRREQPGFVLADDASTAKQQLATLFASKPRHAWEELFATADVCIEPVLLRDELLGHSQHQARHVAAAHALPGYGEVTYVRTPLAPARADTAAPRQGQHTGVLTSVTTNNV
ncbi:MAG: CoA transferase [Myxococcales bacterium]|nr:CoA transferase [Myxococcales bacterium]